MATTAVAWLLDPAIKKIFIEKDKVMLYVIPIAIICAFAIKSLSVFVVRIKTIKIAYSVIKNIQILLGEKILQSDTSFLTSKHSGKFISNFTKLNFVKLQQSIKEFCLYNRLSITVTSFPNSNNLLTKIEPMYPAPPVTKILFILKINLAHIHFSLSNYQL